MWSGFPKRLSELETTKPFQFQLEVLYNNFCMINRTVSFISNQTLSMNLKKRNTEQTTIFAFGWIVLTANWEWRYQITFNFFMNEAQKLKWWWWKLPNFNFSCGFLVLQLFASIPRQIQPPERAYHKFKTASTEFKFMIVFFNHKKVTKKTRQSQQRRPLQLLPSGTNLTHTHICLLFWQLFLFLAWK